MAVCDVAKRIEIAMIELDFLSADALFADKGQSTGDAFCREASCYQAAAAALDLSLAIIDSIPPQGSRWRKRHAENKSC